LKPVGKFIATEPFLSLVSTPIFRYLHHDPVEFEISEPELKNVQGPLASANIALPWLIFFRRHDWADTVSENYDVANWSVRFFSAVSYMATGGISHRVPIPTWLYRAFFPMDLFLSRCFPRLCASFCASAILSRQKWDGSNTCAWK
jgi:hypothetical protein